MYADGRRCTRRARSYFAAPAMLVLLGVLVPGSAVAGSYDVYACEASVAGGANNSFAAFADGGMAAYTNCPAGEGLVARNAWDGANSASGEGAYMIFDAPSGASVENISFEAGWQRHDCSYGLNLVA